VHHGSRSFCAAHKADEADEGLSTFDRCFDEALNGKPFGRPALQRCRASMRRGRQIKRFNPWQMHRKFRALLFNNHFEMQQLPPPQNFVTPEQHQICLLCMNPSPLQQTDHFRLDSTKNKNYSFYFV